jgi:catechol 2,3-dioxygenase-like lactoylglutathione lyase family enzyme
MLAVPDAPAALAWYKRALGATELWNLGTVVGMEIDGAPIFLGEPEQNGWETPAKLGAPAAVSGICPRRVHCRHHLRSAASHQNL